MSQLLTAQRLLPKEKQIWVPKTLLGKSVERILPHVPEEMRAEVIDLMKSAVVVESSLSAKVFRGYGAFLQGLIDFEEVVTEDYGEVSRKVITNAGVGYIVDAFQNLVELENMKFHGLGTGSTAEAAGDTALVTELTTEYNPNSTRATGSTTENAANIYESVGTNTLDSGTPALREHGLFSANAAGVLFDRSVFATITLDGGAGDALQTTYRATFTSGG
jgi:hypothetical protein